MNNSSKKKVKYMHSPFIDHLEIEVVEEKKKRVLLKVNIKEFHLNTNNVLHGGVNATILDTILGLEIKRVTGAQSVTINLNISYLAPISLNDEIFATGRIINEGYKIVTVEGEIYTDENKIVSKGIGTFKLIRK